VPEIYRPCLGAGDYIRKNGFKEVLIGLSGGIDSALTAIAVDALVRVWSSCHAFEVLF
jgi:NAD+ synthase (glutamine-hydrolysing)